MILILPPGHYTTSKYLHLDRKFSGWLSAYFWTWC